MKRGNNSVYFNSVTRITNKKPLPLVSSQLGGLAHAKGGSRHVVAHYCIRMPTSFTQQPLERGKQQSWHLLSLLHGNTGSIVHFRSRWYGSGALATHLTVAPGLLHNEVEDLHRVQPLVVAPRRAPLPKRGTWPHMSAIKGQT